MAITLAIIDAPFPLPHFLQTPSSHSSSAPVTCRWTSRHTRTPPTCACLSPRPTWTGSGRRVGEGQVVCRGKPLASGWREGGTGDAQVKAGTSVVEFAPFFSCHGDFYFPTLFFFFSLGDFSLPLMYFSSPFRCFLSSGNYIFFPHNSLRNGDARCFLLFH